MNIESNIPIPPAKKREVRARSAVSKTVLEMKAGDSVLCESEREAENLRHVGKYYKLKMAVRKTPEGFRVWRTA